MERDPLTGKFRQISRTFRGGKRQAEIALARLVGEVPDGRHVGSTHTVGYLLDRWIEHLEAIGRTPKTIDGYRSLIRARLRPAFGSVELRKLTPEHLDTFYRALVADGLSPTSVRHCHAAMSTALRQARKWGWIDRSPADRASPPWVPHPEIQSPTAAEIADLIAEMERNDHDLASMVFVAATTGCRRSELCGLRWSDIDFDTATLLVRRSISDTSRGVSEKDPKTHRGRRISLDASTAVVLANQHQHMITRAPACDVTLASDAYLWSQDPTCAVPYRPNRVTDAFRTVRNRLGYKHIDFHHLRTSPHDPGRRRRGRPNNRRPARSFRPLRHLKDLRPLPGGCRPPARGHGSIGLPHGW
jgi:integrase